MEPSTTSKTRNEVEGALEFNTTSFFYHSTPGSYSHSWEQSTIYNRIESSAILGQQSNDSEETETLSRCFNCGDPKHKVSACSLPANRDVIALSRQYYHFFHGDSEPQWPRIHIFESRRQQRLDWLEAFRPGEIRGELLQFALAGSIEWLKNICVWGYPPGWFSEIDPRERVKARIWNEYDWDDHDSSEMFEIYREDEVEQISINAEEEPDLGKDDGNTVLDNHQAEMLSNKQILRNDIHGTGMKRWARYPNQYFSSELLFVYTPTAPSSLPPSWDDTSFVDTTAYLFQHYFSSRPPSPSVSPPPLPPTAVPHLPPASEPYLSPSSESDMELSDS